MNFIIFFYTVTILFTFSNEYIFKGDNSVKVVLPPILKDVYSKRKKMLPLGANAFL